MAYITREDGEHFVIPSYRDVLSIKNKNQLKKEILLLSKNYGEYITLQKKTNQQYEIAFSSETGYLLGESVWYYFKKPSDLIYCEAIPNTTEAILVIVKAGSVYLDGRFPLESISEELIIFLTQENNFEIYTYGNVPISEQTETGKFSFDANSVKSFTKLEKPVFPALPLLKIYQFQLVDAVLRNQGIGVFPIRQLMTGVLLVAILYLGYSYLLVPKPKPVPKEEVNPYQGYLDALQSPAPDQEFASFMEQFFVFFQIPGWKVTSVKYGSGMITAVVVSVGGTIEDLYIWTGKNKANVRIITSGINLTMAVSSKNRPMPMTIMNLDKVIASMSDRLQLIYPGNHMTLDTFVRQVVYNQVKIRISFQEVSTAVLSLIGEQFIGLPLVISDIDINVNDSLSGSITLNALGS